MPWSHCMRWLALSQCLIAAALMLLVAHHADARPEELVCRGYLSDGDRQIGTHEISVQLNVEGGFVTVTGLPVFSWIRGNIEKEPHAYYGHADGWEFRLSRETMRVSYFYEGYRLEGRCQHGYPLV